MPCYHPLKGWRSKTNNKNGRRPIVFNRRDGYEDQPIELPCGQCVGCRLERSRQWAIRIVHEASLYEDNCFLTLTYNNENLPPDGSLKTEHFQEFMKRFRMKNSIKVPYSSLKTRRICHKRYTLRKIRFFHCGEYGDQEGRPHYHACIFNYNFRDKKLYSRNNGFPLYTSEELQALWPHGFCTIGSLTFETAAYTARYIMKKVTGDKAEDHYNGKKPEYITMSRRPGIGKTWFEKFKSDIYPHDYVVINGKKVGVPKFYDQLLEEKELLKIKSLRKYEAYNHMENNTLRRLLDRETCKIAQTSTLKRSL